MKDGGLAISRDVAVGTSARYSGDFRVAEHYRSNQYSQVVLGAHQLSGGQWVGPTVRSQNRGQNTYLGIYFWQNGKPILELDRRSAGVWTQLGKSIPVAPLPGGTVLTLVAFGSKISFWENGVKRIAVTDDRLTGGNPGLMTYGFASAAGWTGDDATATSPATRPADGLQAQFAGTDANGIESYDFTSPDDGGGIHVLRVLTPTHPTPGVPHNFLYVLPVVPEESAQFGDGIQTLLKLNAENQYNLTIVEPAFALSPWYANNSDDPSIQYETFMTHDLVPWVERNFGDPNAAAAGGGQNWLIGFSKSGYGAQDLIFRYPRLFSLAASWDFPADMATYDAFASSTEEAYGTDANFQANYRLTATFLDGHKTPFLSSNRIWIGGYDDLFATDVAEYDALLTSEGIPHTTEAPLQMAHRWDSGWVQIALSALSQDSAALAAAR